MARMHKAIAVAAAAGLLLGAGCKKKDEGNAGTNNGSNAQAQNGAGNGNAVKTPDQNAPPAQQIAGCNSDFKEMPTAAYTLTEKCSPYTLSNELSVDGWDLTIEPGVELRFAQNGKLEVGWNNDSRLTANGTPEKPIKFVSGGRKEPGAWAGISLYAHAGGSSITNAVFEHAGRDKHSALQQEAKDVHVKNVKFLSLGGPAFVEANDGKTVEFDGNDLSAMGTTDVAMTFNFENAGAIGANNKFPGKSVIALDSTTVNENVHIPNAGVPYRILKNVDVDADQGKTATITVDPGVVFQMGQDTKWGFGWNNHGGLKAVGTAEKPIVFTGFGEAPEAGMWHGLYAYSHVKVWQLDYVKVEYAGSKEEAAIYFGDPKPSLGKLTHVTVSKAQGAAVMTTSDDANFDAFSDNTFVDVGSPAVVLRTETANKLGANNTFPKDGVIALKGDVNQDTELTAQSVPYQVLETVHVEGDSDVKPATLSVDPGASFKFGPEGQLTLGWNNPGVLKAVGAPDKLITFSAAGENWKGVEVQNKGKVQIENAVFEKTADDAPALAFDRQSMGGTVKAVKFTDVKQPVRDCTEKKLTADGVKASKDGC